MKPIYESLVLTNMALEVTLSLQANVTSDGTSTPQAVNAETLEGLKVTLVSPNVSGARDLIASGECVIDGANLAITLNAMNWIKGATYRVQVLATFGTNTVVLYALNITVPRYAMIASGTQEYTDDVVVVSTFGDAASGLVIDEIPTQGSTNPVASGGVYIALEGKANGSIYRVGESGEEGSEVENVAKIYGHSIELSNDCKATGLCAVAEGQGKATGDYSHAEGASDEETQTAAPNASGKAAHAEGSGTIASGSGAHAEGGRATASGTAAHAEGANTTASGTAAHAEGANTTASGNYSHVEGYNTNASGDFAHVEGIGTTASGKGSHAEGYEANASGAYAHAEGGSTTASGLNSHAEGGITTASGNYSHAEGFGTIASQSCQHVCGQCNVVDEDGTFQMIVGNGADDEHRSNAFGVTKSGSLALFKADGTPIYLDAAKLEALIALLPSA